MNGIHLTHKVFIFIQARSSSTRLPEKVLLTLNSKTKETILDHLISRAKKILPEEQIILLIPENDNTLISYLKKKKYNYFEGSLENVFERYKLAAIHYDADIIVRLTADNPFIDIEHLDCLIQSFINSNADLASFENMPIGTGGEIFRSRILFDQKISENRHFEHVTLHVKENPKKYQFIKLKPFLNQMEINLSSKIRVTLDEKKDYILLKKIYKNFAQKNPSFNSKNLISYLNKNKNLLKINKDVFQIKFPIQIRNIPKKKHIYILYANPKKFGSGHYQRCKYLSCILQLEHFEVTLSDQLPKLSSQKMSSLSIDLLIVDHRDFIPKKIDHFKKILLLDNFNKIREKLETFELLPHFLEKKKFDFKNVIIPNLLTEFPRINTNYILIYAGNLNKQLTDSLDKIVMNYFFKRNTVNFLRVGGFKQTKYKQIKIMNYCFNGEFYNLLNQCSGVVTYFGQTMMEGLFLQKKTYLYSMTEIHFHLSQMFLDSLPFLGDIRKDFMKNNKKNSIKINKIKYVKSDLNNIGLNGYNRLIRKIKKIL